MIIIYESILLCILFTILVYFFSRDPIKTLFNYPPAIQERIKSLDEYKDIIPSKENKIIKKLIASILFIIILSLIMKYINNYESFLDVFINTFILWTIVNLYDVIVLDIIWFCHDPYFIIKGSEDMIDEYHDYLFHTKEFFKGELIAIIVCIIVSLIVSYIL